MSDLEKIPILDLLPQRPPFVFVDRLTYHDETLSRTEFRVPEHGLFVEEGRLRTAGIVEHMAQSCAARIGYISCYVRHVPVTVGYIGSVRALRVLRHPAVGETLRTCVTLREEIFGITLTDIEVRAGAETIATAVMKTASTDKRIEE